MIFGIREASHSGSRIDHNLYSFLPFPPSSP